MATIALYKSKVNGVGSLIDDIIKSSNNLDTQLGTLKNTLQGVDSSTCNLQDTIDSISSSSKSENEKVADLKKLNNKLTEFIELTANREAAAKAEIERAKEDFYTKYYYLKPECEKSGWEKFCDGLKKVCDWCAEHWKLLATIAIVAIAIAVLFIPGIGPIISGACWGAIFGALLGGLSGGIESMANGGSFLKGFEDGAFSGAISGAIMGGAMAGLGVLGQVAGKGMNAAFKGMACLSKFGQAIKTTAVVTKVMSYSMMGFDLLALGDKAFGFAGGKIAALNTELHKSKAYNYFQLGVSAVAAFTGGMSKTMKCFVAGTLVLTANGLVAIENIKAGDMVYSADEKDPSKKDFRPVLETYVRKTEKLVHLTVNGKELVTTYDHPFYVVGQGFVNASALCIGSELLDRSGNHLLVEQIYREECSDKAKTVYNFKVNGFHTYFVSEDCVLVHNANYENVQATGKPGSREWKKAVKDMKQAKGKGNNFRTETQEDALQFMKEARPDIPESPTYSEVPPKSKTFQFHPVEKGYNFDKPHIKFCDWTSGKSGCNGHIFWGG